MDRRSFLSAALLGAAGLAGTAFATRTALAQTADPAKLRVALLPDENASTLIQNAQPLKVYLEGRLKKDIELVVTTDYSSMIEAMRFGRIEVAYFGPLSYVLAKQRAPGIEPFAVGVSKGSPTYKAVVIAKADAGVKSIADIRGKMVGYGDAASTSSHLIPRALLARNGLVGERDYKFVHLGAHDAVARAVQAGQVQAGGLSQEIFAALVARGTIDGARVTVLAESDPIPNYPMVMQGTLAPALKDAIRAAFLELKDPAILKTFRAEGFAATDDRAYDILRDTAQVLNLDLSKVKG
ncbi:phosphate/phosphite/phosphonate ABC transporter substrate-binding protein [Rhodoplanes sp. TEM]|uniref:Phosphate/phosphite/phosphonate ABC transporter substrate-binding protein n=1 Tax=Rhodoplanes tepidamans TaxID=200616 RepID=A0ABT5JFQ7_RHOTP|nr:MULTISPECIES: phosphate/phosphite/phosphonate ABC transporter substrate-binding protein [Rhodoplanes]MDC7788447.1 phosphate/phosphite/phosphonate ABC transporter substrate-binding protein [Rhodoplanes tepidamans]MDC7983592.1 phosphate/phosphite/phosphonate ABC transporter substrate-binding protein [Rhodoplanes sp. TEM]MDQ0354166.1 phosphonate transport system substrate-binding protein [Rhodoplanes tepidamans]